MIEVVVISIGVVLWLILGYFLLTPWAMWRSPDRRTHRRSLLAPFRAERAERHRRALRRAGITSLGHYRLGEQHHRRRHL